MEMATDIRRKAYHLAVTEGDDAPLPLMGPLTLVIQTKINNMADLRKNEAFFPKGLLNPTTECRSECILGDEDSW
jgi:hypothetical protein